MAMILRQSTASQEILLGPFVDSTDGNTAETALSIANTDIKIFKEGATTLADKNSGGATHISNGYYYAVLDATDTNTVGQLEVNVKVAGALAVRREFQVVEEAVYDALFASSAAGYQVPIWSSAAATVNLSGTTVKAITDRVTANTDQVGGATVAAGAIPNAAAGASGGLLISGSNSGTTTLAALTVSGATTLTGNVSMAAGLNITQSSSNTSALVITGNGTGHGIAVTSGSGATGDGIRSTAASTNGNAMNLVGVGTGAGLLATGGATGHGISGVGGATSGNGMRLAGTAGNSIGLNVLGQGSAAGMSCTGGATGAGAAFVGGATSGNSINQSVTSGNAYIAANVTHFGGTAGTFASGRPEVNATHWGGTAVASATVRADLINIAGVAVSTSTAQLGVNVVNAGGTAWASGSLTSGVFAAGAINAAAIAADAIGASELAADAVAEIADAVWDEVLSGHLTAGSTGNALNAAGSAGDPWSTSLPGAYGAGSAGYIIGTNLNATVSSRAASSSLPTNFSALAITAGGIVQADLQTIKTQTVTCSGGVTIPAATLASTTNITSATGVTLTPATGLGNQTANITGNLSGSVGSVTNVDNIWTFDVSAGYSANSAALTLYTIGVNADTPISGLPTAANISAEVWSDTTRTLTGTQAFNLTGNITGNLSGSVGSVTGAVGSVTGNVGGNVVGSVASVTATVSADMVSVSGDTVAADNLESYLDGTNFMPVDAHKPIFSISGATLTVKKPDGVTSAYTRTLTTDAAAEPVTGSS